MRHDLAREDNTTDTSGSGDDMAYGTINNVQVVCAMNGSVCMILLPHLPGFMFSPTSAAVDFGSCRLTVMNAS